MGHMKIRSALANEVLPEKFKTDSKLAMQVRVDLEWIDFRV